MRAKPYPAALRSWTERALERCSIPSEANQVAELIQVRQACARNIVSYALTAAATTLRRR